MIRPIIAMVIAVAALVVTLTFDDSSDKFPSKGEGCSHRYVVPVKWGSERMVDPLCPPGPWRVGDEDIQN